jgi:hypothetical protein
VDYQIKFDAKRRLVLLAYQGDLTDSSFLGGFLALSAFAEANPLEGGVVDTSNVSAAKISSGTIRRIVDYPAISPGKPRAFAAPQNVVYGMARMLQMYREMQGVEMDVCRSRGEALELLAVRSPEFGTVDWRP